MKHKLATASLGLLATTALCLTSCSTEDSGNSDDFNQTASRSDDGNGDDDSGDDDQASGKAEDHEGETKSADGCTTVINDKAWYGDNADQLNKMLDELGDCSQSADHDDAPLALFDWDNTVVKNDIGEAQTYWMLANGKIKQPENRDWKTISSFLTDHAANVLADKCGSLAKPGKPIPTDEESGADCADEIAEIHAESATTDGKDAFENYNARRIQSAYAFDGQIMSGYTTEEIKDFARQAHKQNTTAKEGEEQKVGSKQVTGLVRYHDQIHNLIDALRDHGFDVRVISASSGPVAEVWGEELGFEADDVMGMKMETDQDTWTSRLTSCGEDDKSMTYIDGKRCRINEEVFGITGRKAYEPASADKRQVFAAGDSDTDVTFLSDATALRLVLNRNKTELMCKAYNNSDGKWIINPMFLEPKEKQEEPYKCSTEGHIDPDGSESPLVDNGKTVADKRR